MVSYTSAPLPQMAIMVAASAAGGPAGALATSAGAAAVASGAAPVRLLAKA